MQAVHMEVVCKVATAALFITALAHLSLHFAMQ
jgi:hypothetical protein